MIYLFSESDAVELSSVGGKAKSLIETTQAGFNVPEGFVLSVNFFEPWITEIKASTEWNQFIIEPSKDNCDLLKNIVKHFTFTATQRNELNQALESIASDDVLAVRSSSPEEDLKGISFAGMYETTLGVHREKIEGAINKTFASMLDFRVVEYKKLNNISIENPSIAIIVQRQIASDISGIAFSLNSQNNCYDEVLVNASHGLGETIVSGRVTPDSYVVEKITKEILSKSVAKKEIALWLQADGGTVEMLNQNQNEPALANKQIFEVAQLAINCEKYYDFPIDMEWAIADEKLYLLQARPITTYLHLYDDMLTLPGENKKIYIDITVLTQGFSENYSVLGLDCFTKLIDVAKGGLMPSGKDGIILSTNGRQYLNVSNMIKGYGEKRIKKMILTYDTPTKSIFSQIDLAKDYTPQHTTPKLKRVKKDVLKMVINALPVILRTYNNYHKALDMYNEVVDDFINYSTDQIKNDRVFNIVYEEAFKKLSSIMTPAMSLMGAMAHFASIKKMFKGQGLDNEIQALNMDLPANPTSAMGHAMLKLASFEEFVYTKTAEEFAQKVNNNSYSKEFLEAYNDYMFRYGARGFKEIDIATPRISENLIEFYNQLKQLRTEDNHTLTVKERKAAAYQKLLAKAKEMGKEKKFIKKAEHYNAVMGLREQPKYLYVFMVGQLRKVILEIANQFVKDGRLERKEQIFDLHVEEIAAGQLNKNLNLLELIEKNLTPRKMNEHIKEWPKIIDSRGKIFRHIRKSEDGDLVGDPIAPGVIRGKAKVLKSPYEKSLEKGEILVTRATEPSWTPIFINAAGVVLEIGGPLQHGAIIAREYGIPCVSGIFEATKVIKDGMVIEVDGASGLIRILER